MSKIDVKFHIGDTKNERCQVRFATSYPIQTIHWYTRNAHTIVCVIREITQQTHVYRVANSSVDRTFCGANRVPARKKAPLSSSIATAKAKGHVD